MAGVGQGLDWGPPIGAIGIPFNTITTHILIINLLHFQIVSTAEQLIETLSKLQFVQVSSELQFFKMCHNIPL